MAGTYRKGDVFVTVEPAPGEGAPPGPDAAAAGYRLVAAGRIGGARAAIHLRGDPRDVETAEAEPPRGATPEAAPARWGAVLGIVAEARPADRLLAGLAERPAAMAGELASGWAGNWGGVALAEDRLAFVTDHLATRPIYAAEPPGRPGAQVFGTAIEDVARAAGLRRLDPVSVEEFIHEGVLTWPHTILEGVRQLRPGAVTCPLRPAGEPETLPYWMPGTEGAIRDIPAAAEALRAAMERNIADLWARPEPKALLFSGGADSRVLAALARRWLDAHGARDTRLRGLIMLDARNREYLLASAAARVLGLDLELVPRPPDVLSRQIELIEEGVGPGVDAVHAHGLHLIGPEDGTIFVDGLGTGVYYKSLNLPVRRPKIGPVPVTPFRADLDRPFYDHVPRTYRARRRAKLALLEEVREDPIDARCWALGWPMSDHIHSGFLFGNTMMRRTAAPYLYGNALDAVRGISEVAKLNDALFRPAFRAALGAAGYLPRSGGEVPSLPPVANLAATVANYGIFAVGTRIARLFDREWSDEPWQSHAVQGRVVAEGLAKIDPEVLARIEAVSSGSDDGFWRRQRLLQVARLLEAERYDL